MSDSTYLLEARGLKKYYPLPKANPLVKRRHAYAVDGVDLCIRRGTTLGIVGESGCGKTTVGRMLVGLTPATQGEVIYNGEPVDLYNRAHVAALRSKVQYVFQDPYASLNPKMRVEDILAEPLLLYHKVDKQGVKARVQELLETVGLSGDVAEKYPHEFSGGQRQRIGIARALSIEPELIICDEPVSALDVSIQSQILNLLEDLQQKLGVSYIFIAHGLNVVKHISDDVAVMYLGKIVEMADADTLFENPIHPYTRALMCAIPAPDPTMQIDSQGIEGDIPSIVDVPPRCNFCTRCPMAREICHQQVPEMKEVSPGHRVACHFLDELVSQMTK